MTHTRTPGPWRVFTTITLIATASIAALVAMPTAAWASSAEVTVIDGDTLIIDGETVRIQGVDTPEHGERCYDRARQTMQRLVNRGDVRISRRDGKDRYGRTIASVSVGGRDVGLALIAPAISSFGAPVVLAACAVICFAAPALAALVPSSRDFGPRR